MTGSKGGKEEKKILKEDAKKKTELFFATRSHSFGFFFELTLLHGKILKSWQKYVIYSFSSKNSMMGCGFNGHQICIVNRPDHPVCTNGAIVQSTKPNEQAHFFSEVIQGSFSS